jgi:hypothetical protein
VGIWSSTALGGQRSRARGSEIPCHAEQQLRGLWDRAWRAALAVLLVYGDRGEAPCELGVQSAEVSALPGFLP